MTNLANLRTLRVLLAVGSGFGPLAFPADLRPRFSATAEVTNVRPEPGGDALTLSFTLRNDDESATVVDRIVLTDLATARQAFARREGGVLPASGRLRDSVDALVPRTVFETWKRRGSAPLFVYSHDDRGDVLRTRVDAVLEEVAG